MIVILPSGRASQLLSLIWIILNPLIGEKECGVTEEPIVYHASSKCRSYIVKLNSGASEPNVVPPRGEFNAIVGLVASFMIAFETLARCPLESFS